MLQIFLWINVKILVVLMIYGFLMGQIRRVAYRNLWRKNRNYLIINFFNLIGTPVHETGHLIFALLFGYHIDKLCLYRTMKSAKSHGGILGFVKMHHNRKTNFQKFQADLGQFFIGIGPLLFGPTFLYLIHFLLPDPIRALPRLISKDLDSYWEVFTGWEVKHFLILIMLLYLIIGISLNMELSTADLKLALGGLIFFEILILLFTAICQFISWNPQFLIDEICHYLLILSSIGILSGLFANLIAFL